MSDNKFRTLENVRTFLEETAEIEFSIEGEDEHYRWIQIEKLVKNRYYKSATHMHLT